MQQGYHLLSLITVQMQVYVLGRMHVLLKERNGSKLVAGWGCLISIVSNISNMIQFFHNCWSYFVVFVNKKPYLNQITSLRLNRSYKVSENFMFSDRFYNNYIRNTKNLILKYYKKRFKLLPSYLKFMSSIFLKETTRIS